MNSLDFAAPVAVSVVVPTRDRPEAVTRCLAALAAQELVEALEIIIVLDDPAGSSTVRDAVAATPDARFAQAGGNGPAAARNAGVAIATGDYILFTDDDCEPDPGWAAAMVAHLARGAHAVAGRTVNAEPFNRWAEASQHVANYLSEHGERDGELEFAATSNIGCRAEVVRAIPFDASFPLAAGEDRNWCARVRAAGHKLERVEGAVVHHRQGIGARRFWRQHRNYGEGAGRISRARTNGGRLPSEASLYTGLIGTALRRHGPAVASRVLVAQLATAVGFARERRRRTG